MTDIQQLLDLAIQIQQIPAPTFAEGPRGEFVRDRFIMEQLKDISMDSLGNVYARLAGKQKNARALVVSAHLDTVFPPGINLQIKKEAGRVYGPGIGDNSIGVAALFGILWALRERKIEIGRDIWFAANVGEEGLGDLRGMRGVVERFGGDVVGYLVLEGLALGHVYHRAIGVKRYRVTVKTRGGHSWSDYGQPSAVHELAALVTQITSIPLPRQPRTTMNVGTIQGGTGVNVLAAEAKCELDLRSEDPLTLAKLVHQVEEMLTGWRHEGVKIQAEVIGERPAGEIPVEHEFVGLAMKSVRECGIEPVPTSGSTDANIPLSKKIPAVVLGVTTGGGAHTVDEFVDVEPIERGLESLVRFVELVG
ncbi:MAG: M20/M25/M40 family metallo-hydrolase [Chloroflexi bacterium]|nr:M20/M25/M40 family metallo-hydrolase [Chloroflexota bacterium]